MGGGWPQGKRHRATTQSIRLTTRLSKPIRPPFSALRRNIGADQVALIQTPIQTNPNKSGPHSPPSGAILAPPRSSIQCTAQSIIKKKHITSHHITSQHITSHHNTSHHITSHHITTHLRSITRILFAKVESAFET